MREEMKLTDTIPELFSKLENGLLSNPKTFFHTIEGSLDGRRKIIYKEYLDWQKNGGRTEDIEFRKFEKPELKNTLCWTLGGDEWLSQTVEENSFFTVEDYKNGLSAIYSFMKDRPQYFKFRKLEGMFNPLRMLLMEIIA